METRFPVTVAIMSVVIWLEMNVNVNVAMAYPNTRYVTHTCVGNNDPEGDYQQALDIAVPRVIRRTPRYSYDYYTWQIVGDARAYARGVCNRQLSPQDCRICLRVVDRFLYDTCRFPQRAYVQVVDCQLKYQERPFSRIP